MLPDRPWVSRRPYPTGVSSFRTNVETASVGVTGTVVHVVVGNFGTQ